MQPTLLLDRVTYSKKKSYYLNIGDNLPEVGSLMALHDTNVCLRPILPKKH
jgi:hypothetical protein